MKGIINGLRNLVFVVGATVCFALAVYLALQDRVPSGALMAGLFIVFILLHYLPQMESFKAYGVEAKMRARLSEAEDILRKLRSAAIVSGKLAYHTMGWGSRLGHPVKLKQRLMDDVDQLMADLGVDAHETKQMKNDYLRFAAHDLYRIFIEVVKLNLNQSIYDANVRLNKLANDYSKPEAASLRDKKDSLDQFRQRNFWSNADDNLKHRCEAQIACGLLSDPDEQALRDFAAKLADLADACLSEGRITDQAADLIEQCRNDAGRRELYTKLFAKKPV